MTEFERDYARRFAAYERERRRYERIGRGIAVATILFLCALAAAVWELWK